VKELVHLSDLHFGTEDKVVTAGLVAELDGRAGAIPALVAISGDLTQRARDREYRAARAFLDRLPGPYLVVPGNHDIPLYDLFSRLTRPLARYRRHISEDVTPLHVDDELAVAGVDTAHGRTWKDGRITPEQAAVIHGQLINQGQRWKIVVAHHPFMLPSGVDPDERVDGADAAITVFEEAGVSLILSGHLHVSFAADVAGFRSEDRRIVAVNAGTCISDRTRGEPNAYNRLRFDGDQLIIVHRIWDGRAFADGPSKTYRRHPATGRWLK
jgi:3',5'-cyclic AMP phosphodiesterase CpdA